MTELLIKWFIKRPDQTKDQKVRTNYGILSSVVGILCNFTLFLIKIIIGTLINSISVSADAFNNLSDSASGIISFVGAKLSCRPADKEHPFGHGRYEYVSALIVAFLVLQVGFSCMKSSVNKIFHPEELRANYIVLLILVVSIFLKLWLGFFNRKLGKKINSTVMNATSADAFGDVLITSATVISVLIGLLTGWKVDGYMGFIVSVFVLYSGFNIARDTLEPLIGAAGTEEEYKRISQFVEKFEGIEGSHDLIIHNYGPTYSMATIHAEVPKEVDIERSHEIIDRIEREASRELGISLVIHMDPIEVNNEKVKEMKDLTGGIVAQLDSQASIHDFRVVSGERQINLIFDLVVPHSYSEKQEEALRCQVVERIWEVDRRYQCVITVEHSFIAR